MNLEKLKVSFRKSCLYRLRNLTTPLRSSQSQSKHQYGSLRKVAELFVTALSEQDVAKSHDNDVFVFDSSSAILKMERREDEPNLLRMSGGFSVEPRRVLPLYARHTKNL